MTKSVLKVSAGSLAREMSTAELGDPRRSARVAQIIAALARSPDKSFPKVVGGAAEAEAFYRFLRNKHVNAMDVLEPHIQATVQRMASENESLVVHDTTEFAFADDDLHDELGPLSQGRRGFFGHVALGVALGEARLPMGVLGLTLWGRHEKKESPEKGGDNSAPETSNNRDTPDNNNVEGHADSRDAAAAGSVRTLPRPFSETRKESTRWFDMVAEAEARVAGKTSAIHISDREADDYETLARLVMRGYRFVTRLRHNRKLAPGSVAEAVGDLGRVKESFAGIETVFKRDIKLSRRKSKGPPKRRKEHPPRKGRKALLSVRAQTVRVERPANACASLPESTPLNVVHVYEEHPPEGQEAVEWFLLTSEPVDTPEQLAKVVDMYRARWVIEEFFKALKTGCAFSKRQMESWATLSVALCLSLPVAWQLLLMRSLCRFDPRAPASAVLSTVQLHLLRKIAKRKLSPTPTVKEALWAIAGMGGHFKHNGEPGWHTLGAGYDKLRTMEQGALAMWADL